MKLHVARLVVLHGSTKPRRSRRRMHSSKANDFETRGECTRAADVHREGQRGSEAGVGGADNSRFGIDL